MTLYYQNIKEIFTKFCFIINCNYIKEKDTYNKSHIFKFIIKL